MAEVPLKEHGKQRRPHKCGPRSASVRFNVGLSKVGMLSFGFRFTTVPSDLSCGLDWTTATLTIGIRVRKLHVSRSPVQYESDAFLKRLPAPSVCSSHTQDEPTQICTAITCCPQASFPKRVQPSLLQESQDGPQKGIARKDTWCCAAPAPGHRPLTLNDRAVKSGLSDLGSPGFPIKSYHQCSGT